MNTKTVVTGTTIAAIGLATAVFWPSAQEHYILLMFNNNNDNAVTAIIESKTNLLQEQWKIETNFTAVVGSNEWKDYDNQQQQKFYRIGFN